MIINDSLYLDPHAMNNNYYTQQKRMQNKESKKNLQKEVN